MYSRRFYSGDRSRQSRAPHVMQPSNGTTAQNGTHAQSVEDTAPGWALSIPLDNGAADSEKVRISPGDFAPEREISDERESINDAFASENASVYPENESVNPQITESTSDPMTLEEPVNIFAHMRGMTLEDMMLAGLLMMGSSGEYDDETMLILGLILMIGA